jgi:uncharacterized membrane protein
MKNFNDEFILPNLTVLSQFVLTLPHPNHDTMTMTMTRRYDTAQAVPHCLRHAVSQNQRDLFDNVVATWFLFVKFSVFLVTYVSLCA